MTVDRFLVTGIGGQGVILLTKILARIGFEDGVNLNTLETLGGMMRGGPVYVQATIGPPEHGAAVSYGSADVVVALEGYEGLRVASKFLKPGGLVFQNAKLVRVAGHYRTKRKPVSIERLPELYAELEARLLMVPATELAASAGNARLENLAMLGVLVQSGLFGLQADTSREVIGRSVPAGTEAGNLAAFEAGLAWAAAQTLPAELAPA